MKFDKPSRWQTPGRANQKLLALTLLAAFVMRTRTVWAEINEWTSIGPEGGSIQALAIDPHNPAAIYATSNFGGTFKSSNGGAIWAQSGVPPNRTLGI